MLTPHRVIVQSLKIKVFSLKQLQYEQVREKFFFKCSRRTTDVSLRSNEEKLWFILGEGKWRWHHAKQQPASASVMDVHGKWTQIKPRTWVFTACARCNPFRQRSWKNLPFSCVVVMFVLWFMRVKSYWIEFKTRIQWIETLQCILKKLLVD